PASPRPGLERAIGAWRASGVPPVLQFVGEGTDGKELVAAAACRALGRIPMLLPAFTLPPAHADLESFARLCEREFALGSYVPVIDADETDEGAHAQPLARFAER